MAAYEKISHVSEKHRATWTDSLEPGTGVVWSDEDITTEDSSLRRQIWVIIDVHGGKGTKATRSSSAFNVYYM